MAEASAFASDTPAHTVDAFHRGRFWLVQPRTGHRAGMDAMMLAAAVPSAFAGRLADFGAGAGAAGLAVLSRCPEAQVVLVERSTEMAGFAATTLTHPGNAHLGNRASVLTADVTLSGRARTQAGLADNSFDFVIMNPPFNAARDRATRPVAGVVPIVRRPEAGPRPGRGDRRLREDQGEADRRGR